MPRFSVTIPAYKIKFLKETIKSVLDQSYEEFELIVVDDCSPENLKSVVDLFPDERIRYYRNEKNCGAVDVVDNWNICLKYCKGDYVICTGDDDRLLPCCLEEYSKLIDKYPDLNVYHAWTQIIDEKGNVTKVLEPRPEWESVFAMTYYRWTKRRQFIGDFCYRTEHLRENGGYYKLPLAWMSDDITAARAAMEKGVANTLVPCFEYRISSVTISKSTSLTEIKLNASIKGHRWYQDFLSRVNTSELTETDKWFCNTALSIIKKTRERRMLGEIVNDIKSKPLRFFVWLNRCSNFEISKRSYLKRVCQQIL